MKGKYVGQGRTGSGRITQTRHNKKPSQPGQATNEYVESLDIDS